LLEALTGSLSFQAAKYVNTGEVPPPVGNHHPLTAPMGVYRAKDGFFNLAVGNDDMWRRFCKAIDQPGLAADARFGGMLSRVKHRRDLDAALEATFAARTAAEWVEMLNAAGVASGPINTVDAVFADPQIRRADLVREVANAAWGPHKVLALPVHLSRTPARVEHAAPMTGEHTRAVLTELGYDAAALEPLLAEGVIEQYKGETP
jgi:crotonobetainyl-CoA:carnitine CoA-transferase CaiB-like acyl-CoA transferase